LIVNFSFLDVDYFKDMALPDGQLPQRRVGVDNRNATMVHISPIGLAK
jgi:hypothetical protein